MRKGLVYLFLKASAIIVAVLFLIATVSFIRSVFFHQQEEVGLVLSPDGQETETDMSTMGLDDYQGIAHSKLFDQVKEEPDVVEEKPEESESKPAPKPVKTEPSVPAPRWNKPDLSLKGTIIGGGSESLAIIAAAKTGKEGLYAVEDEVQDAEVIRIERNKVTLVYRSREFELEVTGGSKSMPKTMAQTSTRKGAPKYEEHRPAPAQEVINVDRLEVMKQASNMAEILTQVKIKPYYRYRQIRGFRVENIPAESFLRTVGLRDGDVVTKVNGEVIDSFSKAIQVGRKMQNKNYVKVIVIRNGQEITLVYNLK